MTTHKVDGMEIKYADDCVVPIAGVTLRVGDGTWRYANDNRDAIADHWHRAAAANPNYFNGDIYLIDAFALDAESRTAEARLLKTDFRSYLFWRERGFPFAGVLDGFGSGLITSSDGAIILGRQQPGNVNSGLAYLPGGFIDGRDVTADGRVDIVASVAREIAEETGLQAADLERKEEFFLVMGGAHIAIAVPYLSRLPAMLITSLVADHIARDSHPELSEVIAVIGLRDLDDLAMPSYARTLLRYLLS